MAYIGFFDMIGTRSAASISAQEYTDAIHDLERAVMNARDTIKGQCKIYLYSDNAYVEASHLKDLILFFQVLRETLFYNHRFFSAAIEKGSLKCSSTFFEGKNGQDGGFSYIFTSPSTIKVYQTQSRFSGIGVRLSDTVKAEAIHNAEIAALICPSVFQTKKQNRSPSELIGYTDVKFSTAMTDNIRFILSDYLVASITSKDAGRYYLSCIITLLRSLDPSAIQSEIGELVKLISFQTIPSSLVLDYMLQSQRTFSRVLFLVLFDILLELRESIDVISLFKFVFNHTPITLAGNYLIDSLNSFPVEVISNEHKKEYIQTIYQIEKEISTSEMKN